ncbi:MAG: hypothetical protein AAB600_02395 [Patescibacteria group bacterium]
MIVVLAIGSGGEILWYANLSTPVSQPVETLSTQKPTLQQSNNTASWQIYRNDEFGFEVRYP